MLVGCPRYSKSPKLRKEAKRSTPVARGWKIIARKAAGTIGFWFLMGLIPYFGISAVIKIEATGTRLFLVVVVFGVAFGAASLLERLLRGSVPTGIQPNVRRTEIWPRWYSGFKKPIVYRQSNHVPYSYVVLPRPKTRQQQPELLRKA